MKKKAFSLIELLISLITISVILASMAPIITHKMKHGGVSIGTKLSMKCPPTVGSSCAMCLGNQCIACLISCGNQFKNTSTCKCESCTQGNCGNCNSDRNKCDRCNDGYGLQSNGSCSACNAPYVSNGGSSGCIKCDTGYKYQNENLKTQCKECDTANGYFPNADRKGCTQKTCGAGYRREGNNCTACSGNTYQSNPSYSGTSCSACGVNETANANHTGCDSMCVDKSTCMGNNYHDGCRCKPCGAGTQPNTDKTSCDVITPIVTCPSTCKTCVSGTAECESCIDGYKLVDKTCKEIKKPKNQSDCDQFGAIFIPAISGSESGTKILDNTPGVCMTKKNAGDSDGPTVDYGTITTLKASGTGAGTCPADTACCWSGAATTNTANGDYCQESVSSYSHGPTYSPFNYGACKRTVCNYKAAEYACSHYKIGKSIEGDWTLPDGTIVDIIENIINYLEPCPDPDAESGDYKTYSCKGKKFKASFTDTSKYTNISYIQNYKGASGLQLCNASSGGTGGAPRCFARFDSCKGAKFARNNKTNGCAPGVVWIQGGSGFVITRAHVKIGSTSYIYDNEKATSYDGASIDKTSAFSTRCILKSWVE